MQLKYLFAEKCGEIFHPNTYEYWRFVQKIISLKLGQDQMLTFV